MSDLELMRRLEEMRVNGRDIYEVANQLGGYVGPDTEKRLGEFLIREAKAASDLADEIVRLNRELAEAREALDEKEIASGLTSDGNLWRYWAAKAKDLALKNAALERALKEKP